MKQFTLLFLILGIISCSNPIEKPQNLIPKDTMAEVIAELAINDQMSYLNETGNMESQAIYIFQKYKITGKQFMESHKFYLSEIGVMEHIYQKAQDFIIKKDPNSKLFFEKKNKDTLQKPIVP